MFTVKEAHTLWKQPSLKSISSCCFPRHLHYPPLCCRSLALLFCLSPLCDHNSLWSGFLTCVQIGKLQDGELSLVRFMWSQGACGGWGVGEVLLVGVGQSKEDISPACSGLTLLMLTAWLTPTAAAVWKGPQCCAALGGLLPSHPSFVSVFFPSCCFSPFAPTTSFASEARRFHSVREGSGGLLDYPPPSHLPTLQRALFVSSAQARSRAQQASCLVLLAETGLVYQGGLLGQQHEGVIVTGHGQAKAASASLVSGSSSWSPRKGCFTSREQEAAVEDGISG